MTFPPAQDLADQQVVGFRLALVHRMARGECSADLVRQRNGQEPLLQRGPLAGGRGHQEPALEDTAAFHQQLYVSTGREALPVEVAGVPVRGHGHHHQQYGQRRAVFGTLARNGTRMAASASGAASAASSAS